MKTVNIREAKTHLSRLIQQAVQGKAFIIAKAGKPLVKVSAVGTAGHRGSSRTGFLRGELEVPEDFDRIGGEQIDTLFGKCR